MDDLITALKRRDPDALSQVFTDHADKIYRLAVSQLHNEQSADGVVQDTFMKLIEHIDGFDGRAQIGTWLYRVAYNECMMRLRGQRPQVDFDSVDETGVMPEILIDWRELPERMVSSSEAMAEVEKAIAELSPALRAVFILRDVEALSVKEAASVLDISPSAVKVRLHRARLLLREKLAGYFSERVNQTK